MNKQFLDDFYDMVKKDKKFEILSISFPMFLITKELYGKTEKITKDSYDLLNADIDVLASLYCRGGAGYTLTPTQLYGNLILSSGGLTKVLKKLEERKLIKREFSTEDKRKSLVCLTETGIDLIKEVLQMKRLMTEEFFSILDKKDKENLKNIFSKVLYSVD